MLDQDVIIQVRKLYYDDDWEPVDIVYNLRSNGATDDQIRRVFKEELLFSDTDIDGFLSDPASQLQ